MKKILAFGLAVATAVTMMGCAAQTPSGKVTLPDEEPSTLLATELAAPVIPEMAQYPQEMDYYDEKTGEWDDESWTAANEAWYADYEARTENMDATMDGLSERFLPMMSALLAGSNGENRICSPLNVYMALAMLAECTDGESRTQILDALGEDDIEALRARAKALWFENSWDDGRVTSLLANSLWLRNGTEYDQATMDRLATDYFTSSYSGEMGSEAYNEALRSWINKNTGDLLTEQAAELGFDADTVLALASTIYYRASWADKFDPSATTEDTFHAASGDVTCEFMHSSENGDVYYGDGFSAGGLSMDGSGTMWLLRPDDGKTPEDLLQSDEALSFLVANGGWSQTQYAKIALSLPKFDVASDLDLKDALKTLGITDVLDAETADFTPLGLDESLVLSKAEHAARVKIDEDGCEAAAYTVLGVEGMALIEEPETVDFTLDRPFLFVLTGIDGAPLFAGVVNQPNG